MASKVDIANMALLRLGQPAIMNLDDNHVNAKLCSQELPITIDATLRSYPWPFATRRVEAARLVDVPPFGFKFYYQVPADAVRLIEIWTGGAKYQVEGQQIATDADRVAIRYVSRDINIETLDAQTIDVIATALAARMAIVITENPKLQEGLLNHHRLLMSEARNTWAVEDYPQEVIEGMWLKAHENGQRSQSFPANFNPWGPDGTGVSGGDPQGPGVIPHG